ncbi:MAG: hypothetical protein A6F71_08255 [Cycloclasticus sp. symbiont of Poecilosclerida sp. M]|nr:MAG: hypothetical protein A6F71_08255 [Cycloclasticus sp. symbiont of Poecilosclerida sp. M]
MRRTRGRNIGYYEGRHSTKRWITDDEDIQQMYSKFKSSEIHLYGAIFSRNVKMNPPPPKKKEERMDKETGKRRESRECI